MVEEQSRLMLHVAACCGGPGRTNHASADQIQTEMERGNVDAMSQITMYSHMQLSDISLEADELDPTKLKTGKKKVAYASMKVPSNVHIGLHHWQIIHDSIGSYHVIMVVSCLCRTIYG